MSAASKSSVFPSFPAVIESLDHEGRGVAHVDGKVVFVEGALPRERVQYEPSRKKKHFETAKLVSITRESSDRTNAKCGFYEICGGCAQQHATPSLQVAAKQRVLEDNLARIGRVVPERVLPPIYASPWGYRHRARLSSHYVAKKGGVLVGFREKKSSYVADMHSCEVLAGGVGRMIDPLREVMSSLDTRDRIPQIEVAVGERVTALVLRILEPLTAADEIKLKAFADTHKIQWWVQVKGPETAVPWYPLDAPDLTYTLPEFGLELNFRPTEFTQVNHRVNRLMVKRAIDLLDPQPGETIADLFCGLGNFSLPIAARGANVIGVEGSEALTTRAAENAARNGLAGQSRFFAADLYTDQEAAMRKVPPVSKMLIDPPRDGAVEVCKLLGTDLRPELKRIVYVSCSPSTLARDAAVLTELHGFKLKAAGVVNMFPHTAHVESIALFERERE
ncbi:MAG: 23S rRNA (uracil(1939)-C(5))-methyltransferase RlmD [Betaproteobacteria bacterium]|nr:23S rRNA (uracil(1939)-C(5))-methyltransferase RlmD [Betaproteobacteria bacterium]